MDMNSVLIAILVLFPFAAAIVCLAIRNSRVRAPVIVLSALVLIVSSIVLLPQVLSGGPIEVTLGSGWATTVMVVDFLLIAYFLYVGIRHRNWLVLLMVALQAIFLPLFEFGLLPHHFDVTPTLYIDTLSVVLCLIISIIGSLICVYAIGYMRNHEHHLKLEKTKQPWFFFFMIMFLGAMNGLVFANNMMFLYLFWELTTLACYQLIRHDGTQEAIANALKALWMTLVGGVAIVAAMIFSYFYADTLSIQELLTQEPTAALALLPLAFLCFAGFTKSAQVPWQGWLLGAMVAPTPVSALLHSSTMVKAGVYLAVRIAPGFDGTVLSTIVAVFGAFVFMSTAIIAISQPNAKRVLAYSTISNLGLIFCLTGINTSLAITAAIALIIFHAISKGLLFLAVGTIDQHIWSRGIEDMQGLAGRYPVVTGITVAGIISMLLMPFGVLVSKWAGLEAASAFSSLWSVVVIAFIVFGSAASVVFWVKWLGRMLARLPTAEPVKVERMGFYQYSVLFILIGAAVVLSVAVAPLVAGLINPAVTGLGYAGGVFDTSLWYLRSGLGFFAPWPLAVLLGGIFVLGAVFIKVKKEQLRGAYMCGENVDLSSPTFRAIADEETELETGGYYLETLFGEKSWNPWVNGLGIGLMVVLFVLVVLL